MEIVKPGNGAGAPIDLQPNAVDPFATLSQATLALAGAKNGVERTARLQNCQRMIASIRAAFLQTAQQTGYTIKLLQELTKGTLIAIRVPARNNAKGCRFVDSNDKAIPIVDPMQGLLLELPEHVRPIVAVHIFNDGHEEREPLPELSAAEWSQGGES